MGPCSRAPCAHGELSHVRVFSRCVCVCVYVCVCVCELRMVLTNTPAPGLDVAVAEGWKIQADEISD